MAIFKLSIKAYKKANTFAATKNNILLNIYLLEYVLCVHNLIYFKKDQLNVQATPGFDSKINTITLAYAAKLSFKIQKTNVKKQKTNGSIFKRFGMVLASVEI